MHRVVTRRDTNRLSVCRHLGLKMSPKRASFPENSSHQRKKRKITAARSIPVQRFESGVPNRPSNSNDSTGQCGTLILWGGAELVTYTIEQYSRVP